MTEKVEWPPLSPAAQAVLVAAKEKAWTVEQDWTWELYDGDGALVGKVAHGAGIPGAARVEAIIAGVNAYARDRELLAMAREALEHFADRRRAEMGGLHPGQDENDRGCLCVWCLTRRVLAALGTEA